MECDNNIICYINFIMEQDAHPASLDKSTMEGMVEFFTVYDRQAGKLDDSIHDVNRQLDAAAKEKDVAQKNLRELNAAKTIKQEVRSVRIQNIAHVSLNLFNKISFIG